jgi:hydrogenase nickel incorporation protein HypA/HybF
VHEAGLMQAALDLATDAARRVGASAVRRVVLRVGAMSGVDSDALRFAFDALAPGALGPAAVLEVEEIPARCRCPGCGGEFEPDDVVFRCPACGTIGSELLRGGELELARVEVDVP